MIVKVNELIKYLKKPIYCPVEKPKVAYLLKLFFIYLLAIIPIGIVANSVIGQFDLIKYKPELSDINSILYVILFGPIIEEILFRLLLRFTKINLFFFIINVATLIVYSAFQLKIIAVIILSLILLVILFLIKFQSIKKIENYISSNIKYFFYFSAIAFGLLHAFNLKGDISVVIVFSLILSGPQIIAGFILGFIRMKYGILYSILFHVMINSFAIYLLS